MKIRRIFLLALAAILLFSAASELGCAVKITSSYNGVEIGLPTNRALHVANSFDFVFKEKGVWDIRFESLDGKKVPEDIIGIDVKNPPHQIKVPWQYGVDPTLSRHVKIRVYKTGAEMVSIVWHAKPREAPTKGEDK